MRRAFSLVELLVVVVLIGIVGASVLSVVLSQQRFARLTAESLDAGRSAREAMDALRDELRAVSPGAGDLYAIAPDAVEYRATIATGILCDLDITRRALVLPPRILASGLALTAWSVAPQPGDTALVFDAGVPGDPADDVWRAHVIDAAPGGGTCPPASGFTATAAEGSGAVGIHVSTPLGVSIAAGAPVRVVRRARFQLYRAADGRWYLGWYDCLATRAMPCAIIQPVSGPYAAGGVRFDWRDAVGAPTANPAAVAGVQITIHPRPGLSAATRDSLVAFVTVRGG